jgi:hypothetical protein
LPAKNTPLLEGNKEPRRLSPLTHLPSAGLAALKLKIFNAPGRHARAILKNDRLLCAREKNDTDDARGGESAGD